MLQLQFCGTCTPKVCAACNTGNGVCRICQAVLCPTCTQLAQLAAIQAQQPTTLTVATGAAHNAQAQTANNGKRTRQGVNQHYAAVLGTLRPTAVCQLCGDAGLTIAQAGQVMGLLGWHSVNPATVSTATRDGATHGVKKDGGVYKDYKVPAIKARLTAEQIAVLQDAMLFVQTAQAAAV